MILVGQYDSPFVRRVGIALRLYGLPFRHETWSAFGDAPKLRAVNPLTRVPTLVLDDGVALTDSHLILGYLDGLVDASQVLWPKGPARAAAFSLAGLATGVADKAVSLFYEVRLHQQVSEVWFDRCRAQMTDGLGALEAVVAKHASAYLFGPQLTHADIAIAAAYRFIAEAHADRISLADYPALRVFSARLEAMDVFREISQPFIPPA